MYCYSRISIDGKIYGHLEHAIEKNNSKRLVECIPNVGISCAICNDSFKKIGERKRKLDEDTVELFHKNAKCTEVNRKQCTIPCRALRRLQDEYHKKETAEMILQPMGAQRNEKKENLRIQYDILKSEFQPAISNHNYSESEIAFIQEHIMHFRLNDSRYKPCKVYDFIRNVIDSGGALPQYEYPNMVVELFAERLKQRSREDRLKLCEAIFISGFLTA